MTEQQVEDVLFNYYGIGPGGDLWVKWRDNYAKQNGLDLNNDHDEDKANRITDEYFKQVIKDDWPRFKVYL